MSEKIKRKIRNLFNYLKKMELQITTLIIITIIGSLILSNYVFLNRSALTVVITSASIIVALIIGFLFNSFFNIKQIRLEKLSRFSELQKRLIPYQRAFYIWTDQIRRRNEKIDFQLGIPYMQLRKSIDFWEKNSNAYAIDFVKSLYEVGSKWWEIPDFEKTHSIVNEENLKNMYEGIIEANGLLTRRKHYKHIFRILGWKDTDDFNAITVADSSLGMEHLVKPLLTKKTDNWRVLEFWYAKIDEATDILERMISNGRFVYSFVSKDIKKLSYYLLLISLFGVIIPLLLILLAELPLQLSIMTFFTNLSITGFLVFFILSLFTIFNKVKEDKLTLG